MNRKTKTKPPNKLTKNNNSNGSSGRFLLCCTPQAVDVINMNDVGSVRPVRGCTDGSIHEPVLTYFRAMEENKQGVALPRVLPAAVAAAAAASLCGDDDKNIISVKEEKGLKIIKKMKKKKKNKGSSTSSSTRPRLLGILKAFFFETSVAKRIRKRKTKQTNSGSISSNERPSLLKEFDQDGSITSSYASACTSSSDHTNKSFRLERKQEQQRDIVVVEAQHHQHYGRGCYDPNVGLCFILISLLILILWGKLCAIFCTSTWLFLGARWNIGNQS